MLGYVGYGMADVAAIGNIFASPSPDIIHESIIQADSGKGVVLVYGNYSGDVLNCRLAVQRAKADGIDVRTVFVSDDVASAGPTEIDKRRGIAGDIIVFKATGAAAEAGMALDDVERIARKSNANTREHGRGAHQRGVAGRRPTDLRKRHQGRWTSGWESTASLASAESRWDRRTKSASSLLMRVLDDLGCPPGSRTAVLVNGFGATPSLEQYLVIAPPCNHLSTAA